jgi:hypothetical protein
MGIRLVPQYTCTGSVQSLSSAIGVVIQGSVLGNTDLNHHETSRKLMGQIQLSILADCHCLSWHTVVLILPWDHHCFLAWVPKVIGQNMCPVATRQMHVLHQISKFMKLLSSKGSAIEPLLATTLDLSLEHAPSVSQGVGSDKLIKDERTIMYLV